MDQIAAALVKLIEAGAPLAMPALILYYVSAFSAQILTAGTFITITVLVGRCVRYHIDHNGRR